MHSSRAGVVELSAGEDDDVTTVANQDADAGTGQALYLGVDKAAHAFTPAPVTGVRVARGPLASAVSWPNGTITSVAIVDHTTKQLKKVEVIAPTVGLVAVADGFLFAAQEGQNVVVRKLPYPCQ
jgi:hypothetical protein